MDFFTHEEMPQNNFSCKISVQYNKITIYPSRYQAKMNGLAETIQEKYKHKLEEAIEKWKNDKENIETKFKEELSKEKENAQKHADRYNIAKRKLEEMVQKMKEVTFESESKIANFIEEIKTLRQTIESLECKIRELEERPSSEKLFQVNI